MYIDKNGDKWYRVTFFTDRVFEEDRCTVMTDKPVYEAHFKIKSVDTFVRAECTAVDGGVGYSKIIPLKNFCNVIF